MAVCPRAPQPLPLLKRQRFELAGCAWRLLTAPLGCWQLPGSVSMSGRDGGGCSSRVPHPAVPEGWRGQTLQRCSWVPLVPLEGVGPSAAVLCPDGSSTELIPGDALSPPWPRLVQSRSEGAGQSPPTVGFCLRNSGGEQTTQQLAVVTLR